ncbi:MAG: hypothetical protein IJ300_08145 [Clostridia bacterium]|nr:hypothetical protein [Clostridia bacterium]
MNQETFIYRYSAKQNSEVLAIRKKYLPCEESKYDELKRLDNTVQNSGIIEALSTGIGGMLVFGLGMCLVMKVLGSGVLIVGLGVAVGILGMIMMLSAYPLYRKIFAKTKTAIAPRILELAAELSGEKNQEINEN